jgi:hypothetical protein
MLQEGPTAESARAALQEARSRATAIHRTDKQFGGILFAIAAVYLIAALVVVWFPGGASPWGLVVFIGIVVGGLAGSLFMLWRIRAYSRRGALKFTMAVAAFTWWNAAVAGASIATGWWAPHQPATHFAVSALVAVAPLLVAGFLVFRRV